MRQLRRLLIVDAALSDEDLRALNWVSPEEVDYLISYVLHSSNTEAQNNLENTETKSEVSSR